MGRRSMFSDDEVIAAYDRHRSLKRAADKLGVSHQAVWSRLRRAGYTKTYGKPFGTPTTFSREQAKAAFDAIQTGRCMRDVASEMRVAVKTLSRELHKTGMRMKLPRIETTDWSEAEVSIVKRHYKKDLSASQIAAVLGRSRNEVIGKAHRMGL